MPAVSEKQRRFMAMAMTDEGRSRLRASGRKELPPKSVAREFVEASKGKKLPLRK